MSSLRSKNKARKGEESGSSQQEESNHLNTSSGSNAGTPVSPASPKDPLDDIQTLSLEEIPEGGAATDRKGSGKSGKTRKSKASSKKSRKKVLSSSGGDSIFTSEGASGDIVRSGHLEFQSMYASNDCGLTGPVTVNVVNAPNNSTMQCGCENINCPFCNLMLSIEKTDPTVLQ